MRLGAFLRKEWFGIRRNLAVLLVLLVVLPGSAAVGTAAFQHTVPEDIPVGVVPTDDTVTEEELDVIQGGLALYATPVGYDDPATAVRALEREEVYLVLEIPPGLFDENGTATIRLVSDQRIAPFQEPANVTESLLAGQLRGVLPADVRVEHDRIGHASTLSEYLVPTALLVILLVFAFVYVPFDLYRERAVYDRVALQDGLPAAIAAKLLVAGALAVVPVIVFQLVSLQVGYRVAHFRPQALVVLAITFVYTAAFAAAIMFLARLRRVGLFLNLGVLAFLLTFSSVVYPVGFFSALRKDVAVALPTYHSAVMARSAMLKDASLGAFSPRGELLALGAVGALLALRSSIWLYRRRM